MYHVMILLDTNYECGDAIASAQTAFLPPVCRRQVWSFTCASRFRNLGSSVILEA